MYRSLLFLLIIFLPACKSQPQPQAETEYSIKNPAVLEFERIEAYSIDNFALHYRLKIGNPQSQTLAAELKDWKLSFNGAELAHNKASLALDAEAARGARFFAEPFSSIEKKIILRINLNDAPSTEDGYLANLELALDCRYGHNAPVIASVAANTVFPRIREPAFEITSIAIIRADLVNTQFKASLRISNPNVFEVYLMSLGYELYGGGIFWASGRESGILHIPAQSSCETEFRFTMNFINTNRRLLDDIIAMRQVRYLFSGEAEVGTGIPHLPSFRMRFERSGNSQVLK